MSSESKVEKQFILVDLEYVNKNHIVWIKQVKPGHDGRLCVKFLLDNTSVNPKIPHDIRRVKYTVEQLQALPKKLGDNFLQIKDYWYNIKYIYSVCRYHISSDKELEEKGFSRMQPQKEPIEKTHWKLNLKIPFAPSKECDITSIIFEEPEKDKVDAIMRYLT